MTRWCSTLTGAPLYFSSGTPDRPGWPVAGWLTIAVRRSRRWHVDLEPARTALEPRDPSRPCQFGTGVRERGVAPAADLVGAVDRLDEGVGQRVDVVGGHQPARGVGGIEVDHRREPAAAGGDHRQAHCHRLERRLGIRVVDGWHYRARRRWPDPRAGRSDPASPQRRRRRRRPHRRRPPGGRPPTHRDGHPTPGARPAARSGRGPGRRPARGGAPAWLR